MQNMPVRKAVRNVRRSTLAVRFAFALCALAAPLAAGYTARRAWLPVVGYASGSGGRGFYTTLLIANTSAQANHLRLSFYAAGQPGQQPRTMSMDLRAYQAGRFAVGPDLVGAGGGGVGAMRISGSSSFVAQARLFSRAPNDPPGSEVGMTLNAIPQGLAIGTGETTTILAPAAAGRYKFYAVETAGFPINFSVSPFDADGHPLPPRRLYLGVHEQRSWTLEEVFGVPAGTIAELRLTGINGSGRIVAVGTEIASISHDFSAYEMTFPTKPRHRMRAGEITAYVAVALAIVAAAIVTARRRP